MGNSADGSSLDPEGSRALVEKLRDPDLLLLAKRSWVLFGLSRGLETQAFPGGIVQAVGASATILCGPWGLVPVQCGLEAGTE